MSITEARLALGDLADDAKFLGKPSYLTRHGKVVAVVVPPEAAERVYGKFDGNAA